MTAPIRAIIVDDEPPAREQLRALLAAEPDVVVVGEAGGGTAAIQLIRDARPALVFLDVQMPGCDGFAVVRAVAPEMPAVIFVTAYDAHALQAFSVAAVDYLLKPLVELRFRDAVRRAILRLRTTDAAALSAQLSAQLAAMLERLPAPITDHLTLWADGRVVFVPTRDIDWIDAADDHVRVHVGRVVHVTRETMSGMESRLPLGFLRVHRSCVVNVSRIREVQPWVKGDYVLILHDGTRVTTGRTYRDRVRALLPP